MVKFLAIVFLVTAHAQSGFADDAKQAQFVLTIGVNRSVDLKLPQLRYADDDAVRFFDLFRALGARTYLLTRPDENTRRLHSQAAAEARTPTKQNFDDTISAMRRDIARAKKQGIETTVYFIYAGHGGTEKSVGHLSLEDAAINGAELANALNTIAADKAHLIIDACYSVYLAFARGPGGARRPLSGFSHRALLVDRDDIGLLLSTSSARESHEWEALQAGVFSHEVRSGLFGAADANGDGQVSYREIAAFVERANAAIPNERYRPQIFARPPKNSHILLDLNRVAQQKLVISGDQSGHYFLENSLGVRLADVHNGPNAEIALWRPIGGGQLYLRREADQQEFVIPNGDGPVYLAEITGRTARTGARGAAHEAFSQLFALPFDRKIVNDFKFLLAKDPYLTTVGPPPRPRWRTALGAGAMSAGLLSGALGGVFSVAAARRRDEHRIDESQEAVIRRNELIKRYNRTAVVLYCSGAAAAITGALLLFWPSSAEEPTPPLSLSLADDGPMLSFTQQF